MLFSSTTHVLQTQTLTCRARLLALQWSMASSTVFTRMMGTTGPKGSSHAMRIFCGPTDMAQVMQLKKHLLSRRWERQVQAGLRLQLQRKQRTGPQQKAQLPSGSRLSNARVQVRYSDSSHTLIKCVARSSIAQDCC